MDKNTRVSCTDCVNWKTLKTKIEYFGCRIDCPKCECFGCECYSPEKSLSFEDRPLFIQKDNWHQNESKL